MKNSEVELCQSFFFTFVMIEFHVWEYKAIFISSCQTRGKGKGNIAIQDDNMYFESMKIL